MGDGKGDALFLTNHQSGDFSIIQMRDVFLASFSSTSSWEYDILTHTATIHYLSDNMETKTVIIEDYHETVREAELIYEEDLPAFDAFCADLDAGKEHIFAEFRGVAEDYRYKWYRYFGNAVADEETGKVTKVYGRRYEITAEKTGSEKRSSQDLLTGLYHREKAFELMKREQGKHPESAAVILIDLDKFHQINDTYGKMYGDVVLQTVSGVIYTNFMAKDIVGRIAGDQFMIYCNEVSQEKVRKLVSKMMNRLWDNVPLRDNGHITVSVGIAYSPQDGIEFDELYSKADIALYVAKKSGGNCLREIDPETMREVPAGLTYLKRDAFGADELRIDSAEKKVNKKLFDFAFDTLTKEEDFEKAIRLIFKEVCLHYGLDRGNLLGTDANMTEIDTAISWCREDDGDDIITLRNSIMDAWDDFSEAAAKNTEQYMLMNSGRGNGMDYFRRVVILNKVPVSAMMVPVRDNDGLVCVIFFDSFSEHEFKGNEIATIRSIVRLISSYLISRQVKQELEIESMINKNVMDAQKIIYYVINEKTHEIKYVSKYAKDFFNDYAYGKKCFEAFYGKTEPCEICPLNSPEGSDKTIEVYDEEKDRWYTYTATHLADPRYESDILICITDVTEFLYRVKGEDSLTQIGSYDKFMLVATKAMLHKEMEYTVVVFGIRDFAKINDEYGYVVGDDILKAFAHLADADVKEGEQLCRIKGDDFALLITRTDDETLRETIHRYSQVLTAQFRAQYPTIEIRVFGGAYDIPYDEQYFNRCIDKAMKARKVAYSDMQRYGGFYTYSHELEQYEQELDEMSRKIRYALGHEGFKVYLQPKVDVNDGTIIGAEALVRMQDKDGKMVPPGLFIPLAEKTGMVVEIDQAVYEQTFSYMSKWKKEGKKVPLVSVNVSRLHLIDDMLPERMKALSDKYGLDPKEIELEITESVFFEDTERLITMIKRLKNIGYVISMDDFGSGYSTLNFMKSLPVDVIKIDGGFFMHNEMDQKSKAVIAAIMQLSQNLEFETVSEGVETEEQVRFIREQGGKCVQGYYFYKPMPAEEFEKLI